MARLEAPCFSASFETITTAPDAVRRLLARSLFEKGTVARFWVTTRDGAERQVFLVRDGPADAWMAMVFRRDKSPLIEAGLGRILPVRYRDAVVHGVGDDQGTP